MEIRKFTVSLSKNNFGCDIFGRAKDLFVGKLARFSIDEAFVQVGGEGHEAHFAQAEIRQLDMAQGRDEQVVRFQISVDNAVAVQVLDRQDHLGKVESGHVARKWAHVLLRHKEEHVLKLISSRRFTLLFQPWRHIKEKETKDLKASLLNALLNDASNLT